MAVSTTRNRVIEGDDIEAQIAALPELMYLTRTNPDNPTIWETYNPLTGEIVDTGVFAGGGDRGLLAAAAPVIGLAASTVGLPGITGLLGNLTGATGSTLAGLTGATIGGGTTAIAGGTTEDILKNALLAGGASYGSSLIDNYLSTGSIADPGITERQLAIADAKQLADQGLTQGQITDVLGSSGYPEAVIDRAVASVSVSTPTTTIPTASDNLVVTGTATPTVSTGGMLGSLATPTVTVTDSNTPQQVNQAIVELINSQLGTTTTPANLANVEVTAQRPANTQDVVGSITAANPTVTNTTAIPEKTIVAERPTTINDIVTAASIPLIQPTTTLTPDTVTSTKDKIGLTDEQIINILKASLGLFGTSSLINKGTPTPAVGALPTQLPPMYTDDYFTKVQQNYNRLLPAVPRDVASPLRDWYTSQYGA